MSLFIGPDDVLNKRSQYFYPCTSHLYKKPPLIVRGDMQYLFDHEGKRYTDFFAGVSVVACGHCNPEIVAKTEEQLRWLQHTCTLYLTQPNVDLAERLASIMPGNVNRTFFCNSGSEANEGAMLLARQYTGRRKFIALEAGLHGRTYLTMSVTGLAMWRADPQLEQEMDQNVVFIPRPYEAGMNSEFAAIRSLEQLERVLQEQGGEIAAMIAEPIQGNGGIVAPPSWYFAEVKALLEQYGVLLIADEIQTGFGRTGHMFAMDRYGVVPDILTMAKALGNGIPIGAFATTDEIAMKFTRPSASTFGGNPVSAVTALAVLDYIESHQLQQRAEALGAILQDGLKEIASRYGNIISDVRGAGLMIGAELLVDNTHDGAILVDEILEQMKDQGYCIGKNGVHRNVLAFQPPLVIAEEDITGMLSALELVISSLPPHLYTSSERGRLHVT